MKRKNMKYGTYFLLGFLVALILVALNDRIDKNNLEKFDEYGLGIANVVAVNSEGDGLIGFVEAEIVEGDGKILINTNPFLEPDTQFSANVAAEVAQKITGKDLSERNVIFDFNIKSNVVGGPSAGAAMTLALISALENKEARVDVVVTGIILPDGTLGQVGGIAEKAEAANLNGMNTFIVPKGQSIFRYYEREVEKRVGKGFTLYNTRYVPKEVNLTKYYEEQGRMNINEAANIEEVIKIAF